MSTSQTLTRAGRQAAPNRTGDCNACERTGLPILPLRLAVMPVAQGLKRQGTLRSESVQTALRVMRQGYIYVLLDGKIWHAYQVTPEGYFRQCNPFAMPRTNPEPLSKACLGAGHDLRAAFINIDTATYKQAWIAFAQDPWPKATLDAYRTGKYDNGEPLPADYRQRFKVINLAGLKADPKANNQALALEHGDLLHEHVAEYTVGASDFNSIHGWHPRQPRVQAMRAQLHLLEKQYGLAKGVAGLILPDPVGMAAELNSLRLSVVTLRQHWREDPKRRYAYLTSQCLLGIKTYIAQLVDAETPPPAGDFWMPSEAGSPPVFQDPAKERDATVKSTTKSRVARLEERYWETGPKGRQTFQDAYDKQINDFQKQIDAYATDWGAQVAGADWRRVIMLDYADTDPRSRQRRLGTTADCLMGGVTDAPSPPAKPGEKPKPEVLGPSGKVWQQLLKDPNSPAYIALNGQHTDLQKAFEPQFVAGAMPNDAGKKYYDLIKLIATSSDGDEWRRGVIVGAADQLLSAMHDAANRLDSSLSVGAKAALGTLHVGAAWLYGKTKLTQVTIQLTVGECFDLLSDEIRNHANAAQKAAGKGVRAMLLGSLITIPNANVRNVLIDVTLWASGSAEEVKQRLMQLGQDAREGVRDVKRGAEVLGEDVKREAKAALRQVKAGLKNLEPAAAKVLNGLQIGAAGARRFAGSSFAGIKSLSVGSVDGGLSFVGLYFLQDSLKSTLADLDAKVGARHPEAVAAFYGASVGIIGAGVEAAGLAIKIPAEATKEFALRWGAEKTPVLSRVVGLGTKMVAVGGAIAALAGISDAAASIRAAIRVAKVGDSTAARIYSGAAILSIGGAFFTAWGSLGSAWAAFGSASLSGPLGIGIALGLLAFAAVQYAKSNESDALEQWARRCYFGQAEDKQRWRDPEKDMDRAIAALNAAVLGMDVTLSFESGTRPRPIDELITEDVEILKNGGAVERGSELVYSAVLPGFDVQQSRYRFTLTTERFGVSPTGRRLPSLSSHVMASGQFNDTGTLKQPTVLKRPDYSLENETKPTGKRPVLSGRYWLDPVNKIKSATLMVIFWPDKTDQSGFAAVEIAEDI
ncbi:T6SS effector BTH_I2691 family protein [Burkholderia aenigmatica]|uniref:T6SS effector BTH_I2691 family protein n=1 Tax=Burkholderia aenigmatica TaxID=2015348 RepID=UPI003B42E51E